MIESILMGVWFIVASTFMCVMFSLDINSSMVFMMTIALTLAYGFICFVGIKLFGKKATDNNEDKNGKA